MLDIILEFEIWLYEHGDRKPLIETLRKRSTPIPAKLNKKLADALASKAPDLRSDKTYRGLFVERYWRERGVHLRVAGEMQVKNKQRGKKTREELVAKWCQYFKTKPQSYAEFIKRGTGFLPHEEILRRIKGRRRIAHKR